MLLVSHSGFPSSSIAHTICRNSEKSGPGSSWLASREGAVTRFQGGSALAISYFSTKQNQNGRCFPLHAGIRTSRRGMTCRLHFLILIQMQPSWAAAGILCYTRTMNDPHRERTARVSPAPTEQHKHHYSVSVRAARTLRKGTALSTDICQVTWGKLAEEQMDAESCWAHPVGRALTKAVSSTAWLHRVCNY